MSGPTENDYCFTCKTYSIVSNKCRRCRRDYHTGSLVRKNSHTRRCQESLPIPTVREVMPTHLAYCLRDKSPQRNRCGLRYLKKRGDG